MVCLETWRHVTVHSFGRWTDAPEGCFVTHALCRSSRFVCDGSVTSARAGTQSGGRREIFRDEICSCTVAANGSCTDWSCTDVARSFAALLPKVIDPPSPPLARSPSAPSCPSVPAKSWQAPSIARSPLRHSRAGERAPRATSARGYNQTMGVTSARSSSSRGDAVDRDWRLCSASCSKKS